VRNVVHKLESEAH